MRAIEFDSSNYKLIIVNVSDREFNEHSRIMILKTIQEKLRVQNINIDFFILIGEKELNQTTKKLIRINGLDSITISIPDSVITDFQLLYKTKKPFTLFLDPNNSIIESGDIAKPLFKQKIYEYFNNSGVSKMIIRDDIIKIKENADTFINIMNNGDQILIIYDIESSCDCKNVSIDKTRIAKGDTAKIFITGRGNLKSKSVSNLLIYSNDIDGIKEITLESSPI